MDTILWICQIFLAFVFLFSGICKSAFSEQKLVALGQTGVEGLPVYLTRFIGITEIAGSIGIVVPWWTNILPLLTPLTAICFGVLMLLAARIHYRRREYKAIGINAVLFCISLFVAFGRLNLP